MSLTLARFSHIEARTIYLKFADNVMQCSADRNFVHSDKMDYEQTAQYFLANSCYIIDILSETMKLTFQQLHKYDKFDQVFNNLALNQFCKLVKL